MKYTCEECGRVIPEDELDADCDANGSWSQEPVVCDCGGTFRWLEETE